MAEDTQAVTPNETAETPTEASTQSEAVQQPDDDQLDAESKKAIRKARREARNLRERLKAAEAQLERQPVNETEKNKADAAIAEARREADAAKAQITRIERLAKVAARHRVPLEVLSAYAESEAVDLDDPDDITDAADAAKKRWLREMSEYGLIAKGENVAPEPTQPTPPQEPGRTPASTETTGVSGATSEDARILGELRGLFGAIKTYPAGSRSYREAHTAYKRARAEAMTTEAGRKAVDTLKAEIGSAY